MTRAKKVVEVPEIFKDSKYICPEPSGIILTYYNHEVGWVNNVLNKRQTIPHIAFFGFASGGALYVVNKITDYNGNIIVQFAEHYQHYNIYRDTERHRVRINDKSYYIYHQKFCTGDNGLGGYQLFKNPKVATLTLATIIEEQNIDSPANRDVCSLDNFNIDLLVNRTIKPNDGITPLLTGFRTSDPKLNNRNIRNLLERMPAKGYYAKRKEDNNYSYYSKKPLKSDTTISKHFPVFSVAQITEEIGNIPRTEVDLIALGLGSASTGILDQIVRCNYFNNYVLVDFDKIEAKNLRNQIYITPYVNYYKTQACKEILENSTRTPLEINTYSTKFQNANLEYYKTKYIILGFDTIQTRLEAFNDILSGKIVTEYIIDTRYLNLEASIYFIDTKDKTQMEYYHQQLLSDLEKIGEDSKVWTENDEKAVEWCKRHYSYNCREDYHKFGESPRCLGTCGDCLTLQIKRLNEYRITEEELDRALSLDAASVENVRGTSCIAWNIIDIYKFASSYVTSTIREIESKKDKAFTHAEVTTDRLPNAIIIKK